ncbi:MAG TPA: sigma-70 region 4 domain-containing protein [Ktedonobacterales bacterium]|nr:sigma-70 region 4 domain-containing protein [Ktedonobacterales bacterium]
MPTTTPRAAPAPTNVTASPDVTESLTPAQTATAAGVYDGAAEPINPSEPRTRARLLRRLPGGGYEIGEAELVLAIRAWKQRGASQHVRALCELLVDRCMPEFQRRSWGLRHRPDLMEDAIAGMIEQVLREAQDPHEKFMTLNFVHYLRCLCADNFSRVLRQEGLSYRRDEQGRPAGRPQHVPRALVDRIDVAAEDREEAALGQGAVIADPRDDLEERMAAVEAERILEYLPDPLDRQIMVLRVLDRLRWDDIARLCGKTERTMRLRYEKALVRLRQSIEAETTATVAR